MLAEENKRKSTTMATFLWLMSVLLLSFSTFCFIRNTCDHIKTSVNELIQPLQTMLHECFVAVRSTHVYVHTHCSGGSNGALGQKRIEKPFPVWAKILPPAAAGGSIVHLKRIILDRTCGPFTRKTLTAGLTCRGHMKTEKRFCSTERSIFGPWHYGCKTHHNETSYL